MTPFPDEEEDNKEAWLILKAFGLICIVLALFVLSVKWMGSWTTN
jgi:hypothetical protein